MPEGIPEVFLKTPDLVIMGLYLTGLLGMGFYYRKFAQQSMEHYFLAGRKLPGWLAGVSMATTCMNADVAPAYCGMTVITGVFICWWYIGRFGLSLMIASILFAVFWRRLNLFTGPEFYELRFSGKEAVFMRTWIALRSSLIVCVVWVGCGLLGLYKIAHPLVGWEKWQTFVFAIPIVLTYVLLSGYIGVVISDLIQCIIMIAASTTLLVMVLIDFNGPAGLYSELIEKIGPSAVSWHPPSQHELLGVIGVITWTIGTAIGYGGDVTPMNGIMEGQRLFSCRNVREGSKMYIWTEVTLFFLLVVLTLPALGAMVKWPGLHDGSINKEMAYAMLLRHYLPTGLLGLAIISIFASIMATVDSSLNFGSQVFISDVYKRFFIKNASMKHYMNIGRVVMFIIVALGILLATKAQNVIDIAVFMLGLYAAEFTANWGQWWWWRFNGKARIAASFGGPVIFILNKFVILDISSKFSIFNLLVDRPATFDFFKQNTAYIVVLMSIAMTTLFWILVALLTKPDPEEKLIEFYKRARPMGWWGPIAEKAGHPPVHHIRPIITGLGLALLGAVMVASGIIALSCAYISRWIVTAIGASVCIITGVSFKLGHTKFMKFLDEYNSR